MNFPTRHPLATSRPSLTPMRRDPEPGNAGSVEPHCITQTGLNRFGMESHPTTKPGAKLINISAVELNHKSNYQDFGRYLEADFNITGDAEATLPALIEEVKRQLTADRKRALEERGSQDRRGQPESPRERSGDGCRRLGRQPDHHRAPFRRTLGADQE